QGRVTDMNPAAQRMFGLPAPDANGRHPSLLRDGAPGEARQVATDILATVERDGEWRGEVQFRHKDGHDGVSDSVVVALHDAAGEGLPGRVWASAQPAWIAEVSTDPSFPRRTAAAATGLHSALAFPVVLDGRVVAVIEFFSKALRPFDAQLVGVFDVIGAQI